MPKPLFIQLRAATKCHRCRASAQQALVKDKGEIEPLCPACREALRLGEVATRLAKNPELKKMVALIQTIFPGAKLVGENE